MKILVIGGGGREHALVWSLAQSKRVDEIYCCPGNAGIAESARCIDIPVDDIRGLVDFVRYEWIDFTIVGPEAPLAAGIVDAFEKEGLKIFGPNQKAAQLESSKVFAKDFMRRYSIPTAEYKVFSYDVHAQDYIRLKGAPLVIKADGLAAGKGVVVASSEDEAFDAVRLMMKERAFGQAGDRIIIEECLTGEEASFMVFTDGRHIVSMVSSQDHKRILDNDRGPNTGGMGAYSPAPVVTPELERIVMDRIMIPALEGLKREGITYKGVLYAGLMIDKGNPSVLEFNCRLGDPEAQAVLARLDTELIDIIMAISDGALDQTPVRWKEEAAVCVVLAAGGYPGSYTKGMRIKGLDALKGDDRTVVFHGGTAFDGGNIVTSSGRVLGVTSLGLSIREARRRVYEAVEKIRFEGMHYRKDIGSRALTLY